MVESICTAQVYHGARHPDITISLSGLLTLSTDWYGGIPPYRGLPAAGVRNPVQRGHRFQRKADSNPVIADST
jgi:hypothetical protein